MIRYFFTKQFLKFLGVGGLAAFLHWLSRIVLNIWLPFSWSVLLAYGVGMITAFLLNSFFVFPKSLVPKYVQARKFILINLLFLPIVWFGAIEINHFLQFLGMINYSELVSHALAISLPMLITFLIYKFFTFPENNYEQ